MQGTIFAIEEFAVYDGPGVRVNVLFKGCPLRCGWCHNPEGLKEAPQKVYNRNACLDCGVCHRLCPNKVHVNNEGCDLCGTCIIHCPQNVIRISGEVWEAKELAKKLLGYGPLLESFGGGVTFSGGEVLAQAEFLLELLEETKELHRVIETSGYGSSAMFKKVLEQVEFVYFDFKVMDREKHIKYTGTDNDLILKNAEILKASSVPFSVRVPFIHEVNADKENLVCLAEFLSDAKDNFQGIELLQYNELAGAKYHMIGEVYEEKFSRPSPKELERAERILGKSLVLVR